MFAARFCLALAATLALHAGAADLPPRLQQWPVASSDPAHDDFRDLQPFADAIGNARIVGLGEQNHGGRGEFQLKLRLLRFLHERLGFDVLILESGFFDVGQIARRMEQGEKLDDMAPGNIFFMYANSAEGRAVLHYVQQQKSSGKPLALVGFDSQHSGLLSQTELLKQLQAFLQKSQPALASGKDWDAYAQAAQPLFAMQRAAPPAAIQAGFERHHAALSSVLCASSETAIRSAGWWCQVVKSVQAQATTYWSGNMNYQRDNQMGDNAIWLAERLFPGKKAVVWGHTFHIARGFEPAPGILQSGEVMHRRWGAQYKAVQFSTAEGRFLDYTNMQIGNVPEPERGSLEYQLARGASAPIVGVTSSSVVDLPQFTFDYATEPLGKLGQHWDVLFFARDIGPVKMSR
ncbi:erythromycin esterase family protein [Pseudoduganella violacea]|uniref:Erythromycin esterase n=1 Tax=Pseudoduganella violacea TaxID=1715466 RepID=A0A7W5BC18_9BURK|nr:erythromycin esterase family protein [Pseudoduganella violacea]MBB3120373.1 erythromycin esterase [Pseudoduganella violacea]